MTQHTPGPWTVHVDKSGENWEYTIRTVKLHNPAGGIGKHIATLNPYLREGTGNELWPCVDQNARLIAAAPDGLAANKMALAYIADDLTETSRDGDPDAWAIVNALRAAIAKATGSP